MHDITTTLEAPTTAPACLNKPLPRSKLVAGTEVFPALEDNDFYRIGVAREAIGTKLPSVLISHFGNGYLKGRTRYVHAVSFNGPSQISESQSIGIGVRLHTQAALTVSLASPEDEAEIHAKNQGC